MGLARRGEPAGQRHAEADLDRLGGLSPCHRHSNGHHHQHDHESAGPPARLPMPIERLLVSVGLIKLLAGLPARGHHHPSGPGRETLRAARPCGGTGRAGACAAGGVALDALADRGGARPAPVALLRRRRRGRRVRRRRSLPKISNHQIAKAVGVDAEETVPAMIVRKSTAPSSKKRAETQRRRCGQSAPG